MPGPEAGGAAGARDGGDTAVPAFLFVTSSWSALSIHSMWSASHDRICARHEATPRHAVRRLDKS